jgi:secreted trypsin-like serine protease
MKLVSFTCTLIIVMSVSALAQEEIRPFQKRIIGCEKVDIKDHPWQVAFNVTFPDGNVYLCGGSVILGKWVLTAAHCFSSAGKPTDGLVKSGITNIVKDGEWAGIERIVRHKLYNPTTHENDVALVKLKIAPRAKTIDLIADESKLVPGQILEVTGWGLTEKGTTSETLCKTTVPYVDNTTCNARDSYDGGIKPGMLCAGYQKGGKDSCGGDSGGPLVSYLDNKATLVGVVSFGKGCALENKYGVYIRVSAYRDWIDDVIGADKN